MTQWQAMTTTVSNDARRFPWSPSAFIATTHRWASAAAGVGLMFVQFTPPPSDRGPNHSRSCRPFMKLSIKFSMPTFDCLDLATAFPFDLLWRFFLLWKTKYLLLLDLHLSSTS